MIPSSELNVGPFASDPSTCQTFINMLERTPVAVVGGSLLKHYYSMWDVGNQQGGFAPLGQSIRGLGSHSSGRCNDVNVP